VAARGRGNVRVVTHQALPYDLDQTVHVHRGGIGATAVVVVDGAIGVGQHHGQRQIIVERKEVGVYIIDVGDADGYVVGRGSNESLVGTDQLPV